MLCAKAHDTHLAFLRERTVVLPCTSRDKLCWNTPILDNEPQHVAEALKPLLHNSPKRNAIKQRTYTAAFITFCQHHTLF